MGVRAYYRQNHINYFDEFEIHSINKNEKALRKFIEEILDNQKISFTSLDKAYYQLGLILERIEHNSSFKKDSIAYIAIYGQGNTADYEFYNYVNYENVLKINDFLKQTGLKDKKYFVNVYHDFYKEHNAWFLNQKYELSEIESLKTSYYEDTSNEWIEDIVEWKKLRKARREQIGYGRGVRALFDEVNRQHTLYDRFKSDLDYHYEYFLELEKFHEECSKNPECWISVHIS